MNAENEFHRPRVRRAGGTGYLTEGRGTQRIGDREHGHVIGHVEHLSTELCANLLMDRNVLLHRSIPIVE